MTVVHILTEGFASPNGRAFLIPILYHDAALRDLGVRCRVFHGLEPELTACDVLLVDSKYYREAWAKTADSVLEQLSGFRQGIKKLLWFDTTDSTGTLQTAVLPLVDRYFKGQLLKDRALYTRRLYGARLYTDFYHAKYGVSDRQPEYAAPIESREDLKKLGVSWNSGLANYSLLGPTKARLYPRLGLRWLIKPPGQWRTPSSHRKVGISARFGISYPNSTVRYQREQILKLLMGQADSKKLGRKAYFQELRQARIVVSPFGLGEITLRDFEAFLSGCLLVKPDMSQVETWPDLFQAGVTILSHRWDLEDFQGVVDEASSSYEKYLSIANAGQTNYIRHLVGNTAAESFAKRFREVIG